MSRFKALGILLVVGLIALLISLTVALAQGAHGTVTIRDSDDGNYSDKLSDMAIIDLNLPPLGPDEVYEGWLVTDGKDRAQSTGILVQDDDGNVSQTYTSTGDKAGENLFSVFDKFVISIEPVPDPDPGPSANKPYVRLIPASGIAHIRHLAYSWQANPPYTAGFHEGTPKGITVGLREQTWVALVHARLSLGSSGVAAVHQHAEHVVNIIEGGARDLDGEGSPVSPGDGFGVLNYAVDAAKHAGFSADAVPNDPVITMHGQEVINSANQVHAWAGDARDAAMQALGVTDEAAAKLFIANAETILANALDSSKQAYWSAQNMGTYAFGAEAPAPVPEEPTDPKVGDSSVPGMALAVLLVGAILLLIGAYVYRRTRSRA